MVKIRHLMEKKFKIEGSEPAVLSAIVISKAEMSEVPMSSETETSGQNWDEPPFKKRMMVSRETLNIF